MANLILYEAIASGNCEVHYSEPSAPLRKPADDSALSVLCINYFLSAQKGNPVDNGLNCIKEDHSRSGTATLGTTSSRLVVIIISSLKVILIEHDSIEALFIHGSDRCKIDLTSVGWCYRVKKTT